MTAFVEVKVAELSGPALDWAVAKATGELYADVETSPGCTSKAVVIDQHFEHAVISLRPCPTGWCFYRPSADWSQGGPLVGKLVADGFEISKAGTVHGAVLFSVEDDFHEARGWTLLEAACRAVVLDVLGPSLSVPAELAKGGA